MISTLLLTIVPSLHAPVVVTPLAQEESQEQSAAEQKIAAAGEDVDKLLELAKAFKEEDDDESARNTYKRILEVDSENVDAHKALRHHQYDGKWFTSYAQLSKYRREEAKRMLEEHGKVRFNDEWVPQEDLPFLRMGWTKNEGGEWVSQSKLKKAQEEAELVEAGWKQQGDLVWVSPEEQKNWEQGLLKCGEEWVAIEAANTYHSEIGQWWTYPSEQGHFIAWTTNDWEGARWVGWYADQTYPNLVRAYGIQPEEKPVFIVLNSLAQYNDFAAGNQAAGRPGTETEGLSSIHYAYFADAMFIIDQVAQTAEYMGTGVAYWDRKDENMTAWGQFAVRHAAAQSYAEAIDPSWNAVSQVIANPGSQPAAGSFWREKQIPRWFRYGVATYCERYFKDENNAENPWQYRDWSITELKKTPGLNELDRMYQFPLDVNDIDGSSRLVQEAGFLVSFVMDGDCAPVKAKHEALKAAWRSGEGVPEAVEGLQTALAENKEAILAYGSMEKWEMPKPEPKPEAPAEAAAEGEAAAGEGEAAGEEAEAGEKTASTDGKSDG